MLQYPEPKLPAPDPDPLWPTPPNPEPDEPQPDVIDPGVDLQLNGATHSGAHDAVAPIQFNRSMIVAVAMPNPMHIDCSP